MITILFILIVGIVVLVVLTGTMGSDMMPLSCPACFWGGDRSLADEPLPWYTRYGSQRVRCRNCHKHFKEHPDGSLVEDR